MGSFKSKINLEIKDLNSTETTQMIKLTSKIIMRETGAQLPWITITRSVTHLWAEIY